MAFAPDDLVDRYVKQPFDRGYTDALRQGGIVPEVMEQDLEFPGDLLLGSLLFQSRDSLSQVIGIHRFQQVVDCTEFEGLYRILIEGCDKDDVEMHNRQPL